MYFFKSKYTLIILYAIFVLFVTGIVFGQTEETPEVLYNKIENLYFKWHDGYFHSGPFYKKLLKQLLIDSAKKKVKTGYNYILVAPYEVGRTSFVCTFEYGSWLIIRGHVTEEDLKKVIPKGIVRRGRWWRAKTLISISGNIRKFYLEETRGSKKVYLYCDALQLDALGQK